MKAQGILMMTDAELAKFLVPIFVVYMKERHGFDTTLGVMNALLEVVNERGLIEGTADKGQKDLVVNRIYSVLQAGRES